MKKVMVFGTFDIIHPGHLDFFRQAKKYGDYLIVVVGRDRTVKKVKGKPPEHNEKERLNQVKKIKLINKVVLGHLENHYKIIQEYKPEVICLGYDQNSFVEGLSKALKIFKIKTKIVRLKPFRQDIYKSSKLC